MVHHRDDPDLKEKVDYPGQTNELEQLRAELARYRDNYHQLINHAPVGHYEIDLQYLKFISVNDIICDLTGYTRDEFLALDPLSLLSEESLNAFLDRHTRMMSGQPVSEYFEVRIKDKQGRDIWLNLNIEHHYENGVPKWASVVVQDVSNVRISEAARAESEEKYRLLLQNANDAIIVLRDGHIKFHNPRAEEFTGLSKTEIEQIPFIELVHPEDRQMVMERHLKRLKGEPAPNPYAFRVLNKNGETAWGQVSAVLMTWEGQPSILCCIRDITEQKKFEDELRIARDELEVKVKQRTGELVTANQQLRRQIRAQKMAERALRKSENRYRMLFDSAHDGVLVLDSTGAITDVSRGAESLYGYPAEQMLGRPLTQFLTPTSVQKIEKRFSEVRKLAFIDEELRIVRLDGDIIDVWCKCTPLTDSEGNFEGMLVYDLDITRTKMLREQLIRSERLAATGQLAASVAHEINSPLQGIIGLIQVLKKNYPDEMVLMENLGLLEGAFNSIRGTVKNLLDLNRPGKKEKQPVNINHVIENTVALLRSFLLKNRMSVKLLLDDRLDVISGSHQELNQVIMNLMNNAVEAINGPEQQHARQGSKPQRGEIAIKTSMLDNLVVIEVIDNGPGISEEDLDHIFDPYYSRKKKMGMGIGLSICHRIVQEHGGTLTAGNAPQGGAVFKIEFPAIAGDDL